MGQRIELHSVLCELLAGFTDHSEKKVYFQPPETVKLSYPCIIYKLAVESPQYADNLKYLGMKRYTVTIIDRNPDSEIPDAVSLLPYCKFDRSYSADYLNHFVYELYF